MSKVPKKYHAEIVAAAEDTTTVLWRLFPIVMAGLADRPKQGDKQRAREAIKEAAIANGELRYAILMKQPMQLRGSAKPDPVKKP